MRSKPPFPLLYNPLPSLRFDRYKSKSGSETGAQADHAEEEESKEASEAAVEGKVLAWPGGCDKNRVSAAATAMFLVRDLISTKPEDMGPQHLEVIGGETTAGGGWRGIG